MCAHKGSNTPPSTSHGTDAPLMLSVSGARGIVGQTMTPDVAARFAHAFGSFVRESTGNATPTIVLGRDSRPSGESLADAAARALVALGCTVVRLGVQATPSVGVMIGTHRAHGGMVITASHNPAQWNGIKCLNADGVAPPAHDAKAIIDRFTATKHAPPSMPPAGGEERFDDSTVDTHINRVLDHVNAAPIRAATITAVLDSINGGGCIAGRTLLDSLGVHCVHLNEHPTGDFAHTPEPIEENLTDLCAAVQEHHGDVGFAQDPDADRLAIVDEQGRYIGEEYTLALCAKSVLMRDTAVTRPRVLAANMSTSRMIDDIAATFPNVTVLRTPVGEANVVDALKPHGDAAVLGGEGNGGVIFPPVCWVRDSISSMALVLELMAADGRPLSAIVDDLPRYTMLKKKIDLSALGGSAAVPGLLNRVRSAFAGETINDTDGVRIDFADGWVHLRASNTEPIVRLIAEAKTADATNALADRVAAAAGIR